MPETINLSGGHTAEIRMDTSGADEMDYVIRRDELIRANGTGQPPRTGPDPDNPAVMKDFPAVPPVMTMRDSYALLDMMGERLILSWTRPEPLPWSTDLRRSPDMDSGTVKAIDAALSKAIEQMFAGPKAPETGPTSGTTSEGAAPAPPAQPAQPPSVPASA